MEMKSIALCEPGYGKLSGRKKSRSKIRERNSMKSKETTKNAMSDNDSLYDIEICEVIGNVQDEAEDAVAIKSESDKFKTLGGCEESEKIECGIKKSEGETDKETFKDDKNNDFVNSFLERDKINKTKKSSELFLNNKELGENDSHRDGYSSRSEENSISCKRVISDSSRIVVSGRLDTTEDEKDCELIKGQGNETQISNLYSSDERIIDINSEESENEMLVNHVNPTEEVSNNADVGIVQGKVDEDKFQVESYRNGDKETNDEIFIGEEENKENRGTEERRDSARDDKENLQDCNGDQDIVQSWDSEDHLRSEFYSSDENAEEDGLMESEVNVDETDALEYEGEKLEVEGKTSDNEKEAESCSNEGGKRKRFLKGEESTCVKLKKRKTEKNKKINELSSYSDGKSENEAVPERDAEKESEKPEKNISSLEQSIDSVASKRISLPFLESLRGSIKTLSRGDLEELIVQKLCEVIAERSTVGQLRKKAAALERDQERWREKVQTLTKQIREMDMVMKKYMSEVRKQNKEKNFQLIAPLRVTRSVGLQVSFTSNNNKLSRMITNTNQTRNCNAIQGHDKAVKQPLQHAVFISQNAKKNVSILPSPPLKKQLVDQKNKFSPRSGVNVTFQTRFIAPQSLITSNRTLQVQANPINQPKPPVPDQYSSKIIDLTDDDDRQSNQSSQKAVLQPSVTVRPPGQIRVVNHIQSTQVNPASRVAYLVPATTATASGSNGSPQSRQLLIATSTVQQPSRHLLPSVPPLLYKGSTLLQPGAQQSAFVSQPNRALIAKPLKHPAPLPQPPLNQIQKPNWKLLPPRPALKISKVQTGIVLSWNMTLGPEYEPIASYQLYAYQENNCPPATSLWKKVGDVKALPLPMACTLTQFMSGHKYYFAVRAVDLHSRIGPFSFPGSIVLIK